MTLNEAVREVVFNGNTMKNYPKGITPMEVMMEIRMNHGDDAFNMCTVIDIADELKEVFTL